MTRKIRLSPEDELAMQLKAEKIQFKREVKVIEGRKFRYDFLIGSIEHLNGTPILLGPMLLIEVQGGIGMKKGGHNTFIGITRDCEKISLAVAAGWRVMPVTSDQVRKGLALKWIMEAIK